MSSPAGPRARLCALVMLGAGLPAQALAQQLGQAASDDVPWLRVAAALGVSLALAVGAAFLLRSRLPGWLPKRRDTQRCLRLVESLRLSHQIDLCLVELGENRLLIAASPQGATMLATVATPDNAEAP